MLKEEAVQLVRHALNGHMENMVLRGVDEFARQGGDIDVIVPHNQARIALLRISEWATLDGWKIIGLRDIGYLAQICLAKRGAGGDYGAVKIDFFNGASWCALGKDPMAEALFDIRNSIGEPEAIGLATLLQKLLYAGYLRERDWARIAVVCNRDLINAFVAGTRLPLSQTALEIGVLSKCRIWCLRAASAGVHRLHGVPIWLAQVIWRRIYFSFRRSTLPGAAFVVECSDQDRWKAVVERFQLLFECAGFPEPIIAPEGGVSSLGRMQRLLKLLHVVRGNILLTDYDYGERGKPAFSRINSSLVRIGLMDEASAVDDDLDTLIANVSEHALKTLRQIVDL